MFSIYSLLFLPTSPHYIYTDNTTIAGNTGTKSTNKEGADRPMYLKDYERQRLLERGEMAGVSSDSEGEGDRRGNPLGVVVSVDKMSYDQEQRELRER